MTNDLMTNVTCYMLYATYYVRLNIYNIYLSYPFIHFYPQVINKLFVKLFTGLAL